MMKSCLRGKRVVIEADFNGYAGTAVMRGSRAGSHSERVEVDCGEHLFPEREA